jgi:hypothetical protein
MNWKLPGASRCHNQQDHLSLEKKIIRKLMKQNIKDFNISCLKGILEMSKPIRLYFFETELSEI